MRLLYGSTKKKRPAPWDCQRTGLCR